MPLLDINKHELFSAKDYIRKLGLAFDYYLYLDPTITGEDYVLKHCLHPEDLIEMEFADGGVLNWKEEFAHCFSGKTKIDCPNQKEYRSFIINPFGEFDNRRRYPCMPFFASLLDKNFLAVWREYLNKANSLKEFSGCDCKKCKLYLLCLQCASRMILKQKRSRFKDYYCKVARARYAALKSFREC